jgi:hypothetical protein
MSQYPRESLQMDVPDATRLDDVVVQRSIAAATTGGRLDR